MAKLSKGRLEFYDPTFREKAKGGPAATEGKLRDYEIYEAKIAAIETRIQEVEAERERWKEAAFESRAELLASQAREAERGMVLGRILHEAEADDGGRRVLTKATLEAVRSAIASPSPAAEAIGKLIEAAAEERAVEHERDGALRTEAEKLYGIGPRLIEKIRARRAAVDDLQAIRAGAGNVANHPAKPGEEE